MILVRQNNLVSFERDHTTTPFDFSRMMLAAASAFSAKSKKFVSESLTTRLAFHASTTGFQHSPTKTRGRLPSTPVVSLFHTSEISVTVPIPPRRATNP